jgi:hypothetical protein
MTTMQQLEAAQASPEVIINENFESLEHQAVYGKDPTTTTGLTWGYLGGRWGGFTVAAGTLALDASQTVYMVVAVADGVPSKSTASTNWNNTTDYKRVYKFTTSGSAVTAVEDHRAGPGGVHGGAAGSSAVDADDVTYTPATLADWDGSADPGDVEQALDQLAERVTDVEGVSGASTTQAGEMMCGFIGIVADKTYKLVVKAAHGGTITETTTISASGTCTATFKINTTALGGTANSVSSSEQSQAQASSNAFSAGDDIQLTVSSNSACLDMSFTIKYTRTLA